MGARKGCLHWLACTHLQAPHIALDCEHSAMASYLGATCLLQLCDGRQVWVVDTLALRDALAPALRPILQDPRVTKVG